MRPSLRNLEMKELVVHDVPKKFSQRILRQAPDTENEQPTYSQVASPINTSIISFFHDKITSTIGSSSSIDIIFNPESESPVKNFISDYFMDEKADKIKISQKIAQVLFDIQNAQNSSGLLLFVRCSINKDFVLAILKVEREEGVRLRQQTIHNGLLTFDVEHIRDLMLTQKTKLFKIVLFYQTTDLIKGILCDKQIGYSRNGVADFFLNDFLGCMLTEEPQILTKKFFDRTQSYINERIISPEKKGEIMGHLLSELTSHDTNLNPNEFARRYLPIDQRDEYLSFISDGNIAYGNFPKDVLLIAEKLKRIQYNFTSGITVYGTKDALDSKSKMQDMKDGEMKIEIIDTLKQVKSK